MSAPRAFFDLGTNSTRFLLVGPGTEFNPQKVLDRGTKITRLGAGLTQNDRLDSAAIERVQAALENFNSTVEAHHGEWAGGVATSACRRAENRRELFTKVTEITGAEPELISGEQEGRLTWQGVDTAFTEFTPGRIMDIGGGSTEWITCPPGDTEVTVESLPVGVVELTERYLAGDSWTSAGEKQIRKYLESNFVPVNPGQGPLTLVGGTGTTLVAYQQNLEKYQSELVHGSSLTLEELRNLSQELLDCELAEIAASPIISRDRAEVLLPGLLIVLVALERFELSRVTISDYGILAGLAAKIMSGQ